MRKTNRHETNLEPVGLFRPSRTDSYYNMVVAEGDVDLLNVLPKFLKRRFPGIFDKPSLDAARHRRWLQRELGGFHGSSPSDSIAAWHFECQPGRDNLTLPESVAIVGALIDSASKLAVTIGFAGIDLRRAPHATAVALCSDTNQSIVGSLGGHCCNYIRVLKHLFFSDDPDQCFVEPRLLEPQRTPRKQSSSQLIVTPAECTEGHWNYASAK